MTRDGVDKGRSRPGRQATALAGFTTIVAVLPVFLAGALAFQLEQSLGMGAVILGTAIAIYWTVSALLSAIGGIIAQRLGSRNGMLLAVILAMVSLMGIALWTDHWAGLIVWLAVGGVGNALSQPASNGFLVDQVSPTRIAFAFGLKQAGVPAATLVAGIGIPVVAVTFGWQWAFGAATVGTAMILVIVAGSTPRSSNARRRVIRTRARVLPKPLKRFLIATAVSAGLGAGASNALGAFTVSTAIHNGFSPGSAGLLVALGSAFGCFTRPLIGWAADNGIGGSVGTVGLLMAQGALGMVAMSSSDPVVFSLGCIFAFGLGWGWNGLAHYVVSHRSGSFAAQATGISQTGTYIGGSLGPLVFGFVFATLGPALGWILASAVLALGGAITLVARVLERDLDKISDEGNSAGKRPAVQVT